MNRRQLLGLIGGVSGGIAGCLGREAAPEQPTDSPTPPQQRYTTTESQSTASAVPTNSETTELDTETTPSTAHAMTEIPDCGQGAYWVDLTPVEDAGPKPLHYARLPPQERVIIETAAGERKWAGCEETDAFFALRDRVMERRRRIDGETVYLRYRGSPYCLTVWAKDLMISSCPPPG